MWLGDEVFRTVVGATPLVAMDLVVRDAAGRVLLGLRRNRPAQGCWFVPGGRIRKGETLDAAFARLSRDELGLPLKRQQARLLGVYEHFYDDSVFGPAGPATHYVVLAHECHLPASAAPTLPQAQHSAYRWWTPADLLASAEVHAHTKAYLSRRWGRLSR